MARGNGVRSLSGGGRSIDLARAIEREVAAGARAIISFGVAGALIPTLVPGALVVASEVVGPEGKFPVHVEWTGALLQRLPAAINAALAGSDAIVADPASKARLHATTGASAVDMESHVAARIATEHGLPFAALRAIADPLARTIPPAAMIAMRADGRFDLISVLRSLARTPSQFPQLLRIGRDAQTALRNLGRGRRLLGDRLGYADLDQLLLYVI